MKLSTAIRIGSMTTKQIKVSFTDGWNGRCALGAALDAVGCLRQDDAANFREVSRVWPFLALRSDLEGALGLFIASRWNDNGALTREEIADRVAMVEDHLESLEQHIDSKPLEQIAMEAK